MSEDNRSPRLARWVTFSFMRPAVDLFRCCICFETFTIAGLSVNADGDTEDVCQNCARLEQLHIAERAAVAAELGLPTPLIFSIRKAEREAVEAARRAEAVEQAKAEAFELVASDNWPEE